jgi:hypothetical protein
MIANKFWFNVGQRSWTTGRIFKKDLSAGYPGTGRLNLKWSERRESTAASCKKLCLGVLKCHLIEKARIFLTERWSIVVSLIMAGFEYSQLMTGSVIFV